MQTPTRTPAVLAVTGLSCSVAAVGLCVTALVVIFSAPASPHYAYTYPPLAWVMLALSAVFGLAGPVMSLVGMPLGGRKGTTVTCLVLSIVFSIALLPIFLILLALFVIDTLTF